MKKQFGVIYRKLFARAAFEKFNRALMYLGLHGLGILNYETGEISGEDYLIRTWLPKAINADAPVFFDVGANVGDFSAALLVQFPLAHIHAFEPHPKTFSALESRGLPSDRATFHNIAVGDSNGSLLLYDRGDMDGSPHASMHEAAIAEFHNQSVVAKSVPVDTLDAMAERLGVAYIDFLKIDTEGHELAVLSGARRLLSEGRIGFVHFEFNAMNMYSRTFFRDFRIVLADYDLYRLLPKGLLALTTNIVTTEIFAYQNILAVPKQHRAQARAN